MAPSLCGGPRWVPRRACLDGGEMRGRVCARPDPEALAPTLDAGGSASEAACADARVGAEAVSGL